MARATQKKHTYLIQKVIKANSLSEALRNERKGRIVETVLLNSSANQLTSAVGFMYKELVDDCD